MKRFLTIVGCVALALALQNFAGAAETIKIGLAGVTTGPDGKIGEAMLNGAKIAIDEWNAKGGVLGKKVETVVRDDEGKPERAVSVAQDLVAQEVVAVIGHFNSGCTIPASTTYYENKILQITPGSTNPDVTEQGYETLFRIVGRDDQQGQVGAKFAADKGWKKVAVMHDKTAYGEGLAREFKKTLEANGGEAVIYSGIPKEETDFRSNISSLTKSKAEAVFWGGMYASAGPLVRQLRQEKSEVPFLSGDGTIDKEFINMIGKLDQGIYLTFGPDYKEIPSAQAFLKTYREKFGEEGAYSVYGYDAANVILGAMEKAGTTEAAKVAAVLKGETFATALGPVAFDAKGDLKESSYIIWTVKDGQFTVLKQ